MQTVIKSSFYRNSFREPHRLNATILVFRMCIFAKQTKSGIRIQARGLDTLWLKGQQPASLLIIFCVEKVDLLTKNCNQKENERGRERVGLIQRERERMRESV